MVLLLQGMDFLPKSWKPPKIGDAKYLPTKMLGQISLRNRQYEVLQQCKAAGVDVDDLCVSFEGYEGEFDTNQKRYNEMRRRLVWLLHNHMGSCDWPTRPRMTALYSL